MLVEEARRSNLPPGKLIENLLFRAFPGRLRAPMVKVPVTQLPSANPQFPVQVRRP